MKKKVWVLVGIVSVMSLYAPCTSGKNKTQIAVQAIRHAQVPLLVIGIAPYGDPIHSVVLGVAHDCSFSGQWHVTTDGRSVVPQKQDIGLFAQSGIPLVIFLSWSSDKKSLEWRLYDTIEVKMVGSGSVPSKANNVGQAHAVADGLWPLLTSQPGFFSTKIAYCVTEKIKNNKFLKHVWVADYDGSNAQRLVSSPTVSIAPRWNNDPSRPLIFYSEYTNTNVRMMAVDMKGRRTVVSDHDGINMLPAFSPDGAHVVYCASRGDGMCHLFCASRSGLSQLLSNSGNNISPTFARDGQTIYFCSDFEQRPQIYSYHMKTGVLRRITRDGYCMSPSYSIAREQLAYTKKVDGFMQVFLYDETVKQHVQVTCDPTNKEECSWSVCGNYLLYAVESDKENSYIAMLNLMTNKQHVLTDKTMQCSYPNWSPRYGDYPVVTS